MRNMAVLFFILLFISCKEDKKAYIAHLVAEWQNKEIIFPDSLLFTSYLVDTVDYPVPTNAPKIVMYAGSVGCMSCKLQLNRWKSFISEIDSLTNGEVPVFFFMETTLLKPMNHLLRRDRFDHPVCIDREGRMNRYNHFPEDPAFHTFLLDQQNRVVLIGNPVTNVAMKELYVKELREYYQKSSVDEEKK